ncbi:MAG: SOS response-associated peptidase [Chloroflexi bacterium]|nr:SOS response-associated peptidase [Chloroflexota bacterium]
MCGRFTLTSTPERLALRFGLREVPDLSPRFNIAPAQDVATIRAEPEGPRVLEPRRWGLIPPWAKDPKIGYRQINARAETLEKRPAFRDAFKKRRCAVPADGFFEWAGPKEQRQPIWFHRPDGGLLLFAGLYESWQREPGEWEPTFTIITTDANATLEPVHNRMPVILPEEVADEWLYSRRDDHSALKGLLVPASDDLLVGTPVSPRVNSVKNDDPACLEPVLP